MKVAHVEEHYTLEEIDELLREFRKNTEVHNKLLFIKALLNGHTIKDTTAILNVRRETGSRWLKDYNNHGLNGLIPSHYNSGAHCRLTKEQLWQLEEEIVKSDELYNVKKAQNYILDEFGVTYSYKQVWEILKEKLDFNYGKPFLKFHEQPENYKEELKKKTRKLVDAYIKGQLLLAFIDQSYFKNTTNVARALYKSEMKNILKRTGQRFGISVTGIMGVNCESLMETYQRNNGFTTILTLIMFRILNMDDEQGIEILKSIIDNPILLRDNVEEYLLNKLPTDNERLKEIDIERSKNRKKASTTLNKIKKICNKNTKVSSAQISTKQRKLLKELLIESEIDEILNNELPIALIADNAKIHSSTDVGIAAEILNIEFVFLPTYSPDFNPIEDLWKIIKSKVYLSNYNTLDELIDIVTEEFYENVVSESLYAGWLEEFML